MSEERLMILRMIQDSKITPEQGEALLKALPGSETATTAGAAGTEQRKETPPGASSSPSSSGPGNGAGDAKIDVQGRLADLQSKLGDLQSKLGAAQSSGGRGGFPFGFGDFNLNQMLDEAARTANSLKSEAVRSAKMAARAAQKEARRMRHESKRGGKGFRIEVNIDFDENERPTNENGAPEKSMTQEMPLELAEGQALAITNLLGDVKVVATEDGSARLVLKKTVWESDDAQTLDALLEAVQVKVLDSSAGIKQVTVAAPGLESDQVTADIDLYLPASVLVSAETSFGNVHCESLTGGIGKIETQTGDVRLLHVHGAETAAQAQIETRSGNITVHQWSGGPLTGESISGNVKVDGLTAPEARLTSKSGSILAINLNMAGTMTIETASSDIEARGGECRQTLAVHTQSGDVVLADLRAGKAQIETTSGDLTITNVAVVDGALSLKSVSGDTSAKGLQSVAVSASGISGDIDMDFAAPFSGSLGATTVSGDLTVALWPNSDTRVELNTQSGKLKCDPPLEQTSQSGGHYLSGVMGEGQGSIKLQTVSGDLHIKSAG